MSFYKQFPQPKATPAHILLKIGIRFFMPLVFLYLAFDAYSLEGMNQKVYVLLGLIILTEVIGNFVINKIKKTTYLIKYGTKKNVICTKVRRRYSKSSNNSNNNLRHVTFSFYFIDIDGNECVVRYSPLVVNSLSKPIDIEIKEGDSFPIVFNPENPKDCAFDEETFKRINK